MADTKISALTSGAPAQDADELPIARAGANYKLTKAQIVSGLSATGHTHVLADVTDAGTAAASDTSDFAAAVHTHVKADVSDLETITTTPTASAVPKADVANKIANGWLNTGTGNGLDADTVDGSHASAFAASSHTHALVDITDAGTAAAADTGDFAAASHTHMLADITDAGTAAAADTGDFAAASHTHVAADIDAEASTDGYVLTSDGAGNAAWEAAAGGIGGSTGATDNAILRADGVGGATLQSSDILINDLAAGSVTVKTSVGNALVVDVTEPAATTGASQAGKTLTLQSSDAVASTDTAGAAAGGAITIQSGAAARLTSGNANGGDINLTGGAGIGTGTQGKVLANGVDVQSAILFNNGTAPGDNAIVRFDGTSGKLAQASGCTISDAGSLTVLVNFSAVGGTSWILPEIKPSTSSPVTVGSASAWAVFTNEGAGGSVTFNLPAAAAGRNYKFIVQATQNMVVTAASGDTIRVAGGVSSTGGTATNGTIGGFLELIAINGTEWIAGAVQGTWTLA